jgi:hypothetical protein
MLARSIKEKYSAPRAAQSKLPRERSKHGLQRMLADAVCRRRRQRSDRFRAKPVAPVVFCACARHHHPRAAVARESTEQLEAGAHPQKILGGRPILTGYCIPCHVQKVGGLDSRNQFVRGISMEQVGLMPRYSSLKWTRPRRDSVYFVAGSLQSRQALSSDESGRAGNQHPLHRSAPLPSSVNVVKRLEERRLSARRPAEDLLP